MDSLYQLFQRPYERQPYVSELGYFASAPHVGGMMTSDNQVILNPYSRSNKDAVYLNELARLYQKQNPHNTTLTPEQIQYLDKTEYKHANNQERSATIMSRLLSGDPSAQKPSFEQYNYLQHLRDVLQNYNPQD